MQARAVHQDLGLTLIGLLVVIAITYHPPQNVTAAGRAASYAIRSAHDPGYAEPVAPVARFRGTKANGASASSTTSQPNTAPDAALAAGQPVAAGSGPALPGDRPTRIDVGATNNYVAADGAVWLADRGFNNGRVVQREAANVTGTRDPALFRTERSGMVDYTFAIPNGVYRVNLHLAETDPAVTNVSRRLFNVDINGWPIDGVDILAETRSNQVALVKSALVQVTNGVLAIRFMQRKGNAKLDALEIIPAPGQTPPPKPAPKAVSRRLPADTPPPVRHFVLEDFENTTEADLHKKWNQWGELTYRLDPDNKSRGQFGVTHQVGKVNTSWFGYPPRLPKFSCVGMNAWRMWVKPDGSGRLATFFIKDSSQEVYCWVIPDLLTGTEPYVLEVPLANHTYIFRENNAVFEPEECAEFGYWITGPCTFSLDDILLVHNPDLPGPTKPASTSAPASRWRPETTDWSRATNLVIGDWGFNRPGYPEGLYVHGITRPAGEKITNPVIYDNDVYDDVFDDELAYVMASEGEMNLAGLIVTPVLTDFWGFSKPNWTKTAHDSRRNAERSGLRMDRIPPITVGTEAANEKAGENKDSAGARLYVRLINEQFERDPARPVIVNIGGQGATLATAYGLDPSIVHKCIVYYTDLRVYNGHYQWASKLIAANFRVVSWGDDNWWITKPAQNQWRVLPRPDKAEGKDNDANSGEWRQWTEMRVPLLDHIVKQFQTRGEYCRGPRKGDGYLDGTFLHAWLPGMFGGAALKDIRGSQVLHVTRFAEVNEARVKAFANARLLNPRAYRVNQVGGGPATNSTSAPVHPIHFASFSAVTLQDALWGPALERNRTVTIPHVLKRCEEAGMFRDFDRAAGKLDGPAEALHISDETVYKAVESAALELARQPDPDLERRLDALIARIAAAQEPDGYLHTPYQITKRRGRPVPAPFSDNGQGLELYFCGHLYEAAAAHYRATGRTNLLAVALKNAELVHRVFGPGKRVDVAEHQEIEPALVKLYEVTGDERWWRLAQFFVETRGTTAAGRKLRGSFSQDHTPIRQQTEAVGQAPRATYFYSGVVDVAGLANDATLMTPMHRLWNDVAGRKLYLTGGIGSRHSNEGFGDPYELPNRTAYTEGCAAISFSMWNERMFRATGEAKFMDALERTLYNNFLAGVSLSGDRYFYACPPQSDGQYAFNRGWLPRDRKGPHTQASATRKEWFECACCPPNWTRWLVQMPGFIYATRSNDLFVNLYVASETAVDLAGSRWKVRQETRYPWDGQVKVMVMTNDEFRMTNSPSQPRSPDSIRHSLLGQSSFSLRLRLPGWTRGEPVASDLYRYLGDTPPPPVQLRVNGEPVPVTVENGYAILRRHWQSGDVVELHLPLPVRRVVAHRAVKDLAGQVAVERGPMVYCVEGVDHGGRVLDLALPDDAPLATTFDRDFAGGVTVLRGEARRGDQSVALRLIPYFAWANRGVTEMTVWMKHFEP